jgi:hypothetical protein
MTIKHVAITGPHDDVTRWVESEIQSRSPGKYTVQATRISSTVFDYTLVFDDPKEELFWRLKYR